MSIQKYLESMPMQEIVNKIAENGCTNVIEKIREYFKRNKVREVEVPDYLLFYGPASPFSNLHVHDHNRWVQKFRINNQEFICSE